MLTRKVARHVAGWVAGDKSVLKLGNLESRRDWGFAGDYVVAMVKMLQQPAADDYVIGTGVSHSVNEFLLEACKCAGVDRRIQLVHTMEDERLKRTQEIHNLVADTTKAQSVLGWKPEVDFKGLVRMMVTEEIKHFEQTQNKAMSV
jgi:GDPmannose 4,6-dehydratase